MRSGGRGAQLKKRPNTPFYFIKTPYRPGQLMVWPFEGHLLF